ncbi:MAG: hypothetical protein U9Q62_00575 [Campylobacterota bacterium]|nr:hypothetical protein [Campylobacterota bacterium]
MIGIEYILIGLAALMLYLIYVIISKDAQQNRKIRSIATAVEELHRQLYASEKKINQQIDQLASLEPPMSRSEIEQKLEQSSYATAVPVAQSIEEIQRGFDAFKSDITKRLHQVEDGMRSLSMPSSVSNMDDEKIIALFKQGVPLETIAKELHLSKPEVEFVLKINRIR